MTHKNAFPWGDPLLLSASSDETVNRRLFIDLSLVDEGAPDGSPDADGAPDGIDDGCDDSEGTKLGIEDGCDDSEGTKLGIEDGCDDSEGTKLGIDDGCNDSEGTKLGIDDGCADTEGVKLGSDDGCPDDEGVKLGIKLGETVLVLELLDFLIFCSSWNKLPQVGEMLALKIAMENFMLDVCCVDWMCK